LTPYISVWSNTVNDNSITLGVPDYRKLSGVVAAWKARRRPLDPPMRQIDNDLKTALVLDETELPGDTVSIGSTVTVQDIDSQEKSTVRLVFPAELDGTEATASVFSPLGAAIIGEKSGTLVECEAPNGIRRFKILNILV
jgi:transcription elongation GreA/GreB family factor